MAADSNAVRFGEICGALYLLRTPDSNEVKAATGWVLPTGNDKWNSLLIEYMAARFSSNNVNNKVKCATIRVVLNGVEIHPKWGYKDTPQGTTLVEDLDPSGQPVYQQGWFREIGPIILQEHDNIVDFRGIEIDAGWLPMSGGSFNSGWQFDYDSQTGTCT